MKTLADFKRKLKPGTKVHTTFHQAHAGRDGAGTLLFKDEDKGVREISIVQSNSFALKTMKTEAEGTQKMFDSWCQYPKAAEFKILDENTAVIFSPEFRRGMPEGLIPCLTYKFI
jgi:hypothetical protein